MISHPQREPSWKLMQKINGLDKIKNHLVGKPLTWFGFCAAVYLIFSLSVALYSFVKTKEEIKHDVVI